MVTCGNMWWFCPVCIIIHGNMLVTCQNNHVLMFPWLIADWYYIKIPKFSAGQIFGENPRRNLIRRKWKLRRKFFPPKIFVFELSLYICFPCKRYLFRHFRKILVFSGYTERGEEFWGGHGCYPHSQENCHHLDQVKTESG